MERREKWQLWQKWQPAAQATGTSEMENNKKKGDYNEKSQFQLKCMKKFNFLRVLFNKIQIFFNFGIPFQI